MPENLVILKKFSPKTTMFQSYFPQQRRFNRFNDNTWMPSSYYGMGGPSFMPSLVDIFDPFEELSRDFNRSLPWIEAPSRAFQGPTRAFQVPTRAYQVPGVRQLPIRTVPTRRPVMIQRQPSMVKTVSKKVLTSCKNMPQKYRIAIDCTGFDRQSIRTNLLQNRGQCHLIVECGTQGRQLQRGFQCATGNVGLDLNNCRRSFTLPRTVDCNKMVKYLTPNGELVIEFPLLEVPTCCKDPTLVPRVVNCNGNKVVSLKVPIPEMVSPAKLQVCLNQRELILRFENRIVPGMVSRVYCYTKVTLPPNANLNAIKCKLAKKRLLTICAPVITGVRRAPTMAHYRCIPIERKLRHRISGKVPVIHAASHIVSKPTGVTGRKQITAGKKKTEIPTRQVLPIRKEPSQPKIKREASQPKIKKEASQPKIKKEASQPQIKKEASQPKIKKQLSQPKIKKHLSEKKLFPEAGMGKEHGQGHMFTTGAEAKSSGTKSGGTKSPRRISGSEVLQQIFSSSIPQGQGRKSPVAESPSGQQQNI